MEDARSHGATLSRRAFVRVTSGGFLLGAVALLEACGPATPPSSQPTPAAAVPAPPTAAPAPTTVKLWGYS